MIEPSDLLTVREAAAMLRLKVSTIRAWVLQRRVPFVKLGGKRVLFRRQDLDALVTASVVPAKPTRAIVLVERSDETDGPVIELVGQFDGTFAGT
jgi:excisionase family DNA binding protein